MSPFSHSISDSPIRAEVSVSYKWLFITFHIIVSYIYISTTNQIKVYYNDCSPIELFLINAFREELEALKEAFDKVNPKCDDGHDDR